MQADESVEFPDAEVIQHGAAAIQFRINGREVWVTRPGVIDAWGLVHPGDRGKLVLARWAAEAVGLLPE